MQKEGTSTVVASPSPKLRIGSDCDEPKVNEPASILTVPLGQEADAIARSTFGSTTFGSTTFGSTTFGSTTFGSTTFGSTTFELSSAAALSRR